MTKREKQIGIGVVGVLMLFGLDQWVVQPYWDTHTTLVAAISKAQTDIQDAHRLFNTERLEQPKWKTMVEAANGLKSERYAAESQAENTVLQWAGSLGVNINNLTTEGVPKAENKFLVINFHATGLGSMQAISRMLNSLEIGQVPIRISDIQINSRREGTDDLQIQMLISTLCLRPDADNPTNGSHPPVAWLQTRGDRS
jgi:hypothetical protein